MTTLQFATAVQLRARSVALQPERLAQPAGGLCDMAELENLSAEAMRGKLSELGASSPAGATAPDQLKALLTAASRVKKGLGDGLRVDNSTALAAVLREHGEACKPNETPAVLFDRLSDRLKRECEILSSDRQIAKSLNLDDLQEAAAERALTTSGSRSELIYLLTDFQRNCDSVVERKPDFACTLGIIKDALGARSLSTGGPKEELLVRLLDAMGSSGAKDAATAQCDVISQGPICVANGRKVIVADAAPLGLVSHLTFDDSRGLDTSGKSNHAIAPPIFGPGVGARGHSAKFCGSDRIEVRNHPSFNEATSTFTLEMWLYLRQDSTGDWRTIIHKGGHDYERTPTLFLEPTTRGIEFFVSTTDKSQPKGERLWSNSFVPMHRWTHVAAVAEGKSLRLYINGLLDSENVTAGAIQHNTGPFYIGGDPWRASGGFDGYLDEFRFYSRALSTDEIQAEAGMALGGVEPSFVELGCMGCSLDSGRTTCRLGYHLCNLRDLHSGGYNVARTMGWATSNSHIWTAEEIASGGEANASWAGTAAGTVKTGLGLCCADSE